MDTVPPQKLVGRCCYFLEVAPKYQCGPCSHYSHYVAYIVQKRACSPSCPCVTHTVRKEPFSLWISVSQAPPPPSKSMGTPSPVSPPFLIFHQPRVCVGGGGHGGKTRKAELAQGKTQLYNRPRAGREVIIGWHIPAVSHSARCNPLQPISGSYCFAFTRNANWLPVAHR